MKEKTDGRKRRGGKTGEKIGNQEKEGKKGQTEEENWLINYEKQDLIIYYPIIWLHFAYKSYLEYVNGICFYL